MDTNLNRRAAEEVDEAARNGLLTQLDSANVRISEIEAELKRTRRERDEADRKARSLEMAWLEAMQPETGYLRSEAGRVAALMTRMSVMQRRDFWLSKLTHIGVSGELQWLYPHGGGADPLSMLIVGSGGFGDVLCLTPVIRALRQAWPGARIFVAHQHPGVEMLRESPYVNGVVHKGHEQLEQLFATASALDVFDLIADVRYAITYTAPPLSRISPQFFIAAHARAAKWQPYVAMNWPNLNNALAREATRLGMAQLDLTGYTGNLDVSRNSPLDLAPTRPTAARAIAEAGAAGKSSLEPQWRRLAGRPYVTIHHGADRNMVGAAGVQTKNLPIAHLERVVSRLRSAGLEVVQLGEREEALIDDELIDLRGALSFRESAYLISRASVHVDSEGGLVHAARAVFTPSVVVFGPTSTPFFGYPCNANLEPPLCGDCWWTTKDWSRRCARGLSEPECMSSHDSGAIAEAALQFAAMRRALIAVDLPGAVPEPTSSVARGFLSSFSRKGPQAGSEAGLPPADAAHAMRAALAHIAAATGQAAPGAKGLIVFATLNDLRAFVADRPSAPVAEVAVPGESFADAEAEFARHFRILPLIRNHLAVETDSLDWLILQGARGLDGELLDLLLMAARCVRPGGHVWAELRGSGGDKARARKIVDQFAALDAQRFGDARFVDLGALAQKAERMSRPDGGFELLFTSQTVARDAETDFGPVVAAPASLAPAGGAP